METMIFIGFTVMIVYVIYWSVKYDDIQAHSDDLKRHKKVNIGHPSKKG